MHAPADQVNQQIACPDCGRSVVVPPPRPAKKHADPLEDVDGQYGVEEAAEVSDLSPMFLRAQRVRDEDRSDVQLTPPRWAFFSGVFSFPAYRNSQLCWLTLRMMWLSWNEMAIGTMS